MSRKSEFQSQNPNPAKRFLEWKSNDKCFSYYDKDNGENVKVELPFKFLVLMEFHTVKGWNDASESAIYSNEVKYIGKEEVDVKSFKGGRIAKGIYKDIRTQVQDAGGHYTKSVYAMTEDGQIINLQLKGSAVKEWSDFTKKTRKRLYDEWVEVTEAKQMKKGSVKYSVPVFKFNTSLNEMQVKIADENYDELKAYMEKYRDTDNTPVESLEVEAETVTTNSIKDELDF